MPDPFITTLAVGAITVSPIGWLGWLVIGTATVVVGGASLISLTQKTGVSRFDRSGRNYRGPGH